jgi:DNA-binding response OmpR family regulator
MNKRILVVDDSSPIREALSKVLQAEDYAVTSAENGQEAIEKFKSDKIDLVLLDLGLPVKDGRETMVWLTEVNPLLPVIIITGQNKQRELAEKLGADALMEKPLDVPRLLRTIHELLNETPEDRARHAKEHAGFHYVPCDHELFLKSLRDAYTTPFHFME